MKFTVVLFLCLPACAQTWFSNVTRQPRTNSCAIAWTTAVPTIAHVEYGLSSGSYTKAIANSTQYWRTKTATISGLKEGTTYHFRIVASDTSKVWLTSLDYTCTTTTTSASSGHSVKLNWNPSKSSGVTGYQVYRSTVAGGYFGMLANAAGLSYNDQSVQSGITYFYAIKAKNSAGALSAYSNQVQVIIPKN
jgi:purple acid phosphatase-like protein